MAIEFPNQEWLQKFKEKLNNDDKYAQTARNWEGDFVFNINESASFPHNQQLYLDLWHGKCRDAYIIDEVQTEKPSPAFTLSANYDIFKQILEGKLDPLQAMLTRKLQVKGSMSYMMRNIPVVLDFVRVAKEVTQQHLPK